MIARRGPEPRGEVRTLVRSGRAPYSGGEHPARGKSARGARPLIPMTTTTLLTRAPWPAAILAVAASCASGGAGDTAPPGARSGPRIVQPGAPGQDSRAVGHAPLDAIEGTSYTAADVHFMQGMIDHHAQALQMAALIPDRTSDASMRQMGLRITISQRDEIALMRRWLLDRGLEAPSGDPDGPLMMMEGMLSPDQMRTLRNSEGVDFERYFLQFMIQHHGGAIVMVQKLFATPGAGQESTINFFANEVDSDQTIEVRRMQQMLRERG